ncbi:MAG: TolB family protein [Thermoleophilaceae bacterium]
MRKTLGIALVLALASATPASASFPGRNGRLAFTTYRGDRGRPHIAVVWPSGKHRRVVTHGSAEDEPTWSPLGSALLFRALPGTKIGLLRRGRSRILHLGLPFVGGPEWLPSGRIAFESFTPGVYDGEEIDRRGFTARLDGSHRRRVPEEPLPVWSPDGNRIAFLAPVSSFPCNSLWVARSDGSHRRLVVRAVRRSYYCFPVDAPDWSPDSRELAFVRTAEGPPTEGFDVGLTADIYTVRADGKRLRRVTHEGALYTTFLNPAWSPDGRLIAYNNFPPPPEGPESIFVVRRDGSHRRLVAREGVDPSWQPRH